ncbi:hypothetical protein [Streptomyces lavendulocolor]|uniref:hypothetical protein n=1 Tax=Streptomyces lavendulocolor TaxID=67316 RepID=UPI003C2D9723
MAPLESVFGGRKIPVETATAVPAAVDRLLKSSDMPENERWRVLETLTTEW